MAARRRLVALVAAGLVVLVLAAALIGWRAAAPNGGRGFVVIPEPLPVRAVPIPYPPTTPVHP